MMMRCEEGKVLTLSCLLGLKGKRVSRGWDTDSDDDNTAIIQRKTLELLLQRFQLSARPFRGKMATR